MGVTSVMALTSSPAAWSERIACSRPAPGPLTKTSTWRIPCSIALRAATSAESAAAYGVLLREPLKPATPAEPQLTTAPARSVMVMIVLFNDAWMWAWPCGTFLRSRRRCLTAFFRSAMSLRYPALLRGLAPSADRALRAAPLARVRLGSLAADREVPAMAEAPVRADLLESLDVQRDLAAQVALDLEAPIDELAEAVHLVLGQVADAGVAVHVRLDEDLRGGREPDAVDVGQGDLHPLLAGDVDAGDACHRSLPLSLLVLGVGADDHHRAVAADDLAVIAAGLDGGSDFQRFLVVRSRPSSGDGLVTSGGM